MHTAAASTTVFCDGAVGGAAAGARMRRFCGWLAAGPRCGLGCRADAAAAAAAAAAAGLPGPACSNTAALLKRRSFLPREQCWQKEA